MAARIDGEPTGMYTDVTTTSFYEHHLITALGAGGMVMVNDDEYDDNGRILRAWGRISATEESEDFEKRWRHDVDGIPYDSRFIFTQLGYNFLPTEAQAAFGRAQLDKFDLFAERRSAVFAELDSFFEEYPDYFVRPESRDDVDTTWLVYPLTMTDAAPFERIELIEYLWDADIEVRPLFTGNIHRHPVFENVETRTAVDDLSNADRIMHESIRLGTHQAMDDAEVTHMKDTIAEFLSHY
jgi:CDP-6-deoxy-D-xylo-4-hexulose-3-dehydrase